MGWEATITQEVENWWAKEKWAKNISSNTSFNQYFNWQGFIGAFSKAQPEDDICPGVVKGEGTQDDPQNLHGIASNANTSLYYRCKTLHEKTDLPGIYGNTLTVSEIQLLPIWLIVLFLALAACTKRSWICCFSANGRFEINS